MGAAFAFVALLSAACVGTTQASRIGQEVPDSLFAFASIVMLERLPQ
jgi:hypothetical protein